MANNIDDILAAIQAQPNADGTGAVVDPFGTPAPAPQDPVADALTWEGGPDPANAGTYDPGRWDSALSEIDLASPSAAPPASGWAAKQSGTVKVSRSGMTDKGLARARGVWGEAETKAAADNAQVDERLSRDQANFESAYADRQQAIRDQAAADREHYDRLVKLDDRIADFNLHYAETEKRIYDDGRAERARILGQYEQQMAGVRALQATSGNPLIGLNRGSALGIAIGKFAEGFLAAEGIHIDFSGQIDRWVDRSIAEHRQKIVDAKDMAGETLHLYDIARQSSRDDAEAREKFRGFFIEGIKSKVTAEASRYQSSLAMAKAAELNAQAEIELNTVRSSIGDRAMNAHIQNNQLRLEAAAKMANAAHESEMASIARAREARDAAKAAKEKPVKADLTIADPGAVIRDKNGNQVGLQNTHRLKDGLPDGIASKAYENASKLQEAYAGGISALQSMAKLRAPAMEDFSSLTGINAVKAYNEAYRKYNAEKGYFSEKLINSLTGAAAPEEQMKRINNFLQDDSLWQKGDNAAMLSQLEMELRRSLRARLDTDPALEPITDANRTQDNAVRATPAVSSDTEARYNTDMFGEKPTSSPVSKAAAGAVDGNRNDVAPGGGYSPSYRKYLDQGGDSSGDGRTSNIEKQKGQRREIDAIDHLAAIYLKPEHALAEGETVNGKATTSPETLKSGSLAALKAIAEGHEIGGRKPDEGTQAYAKHVVHELSDPWLEANNSESVTKHLYEQYASRERVVEDGDKPSTSTTPRHLK